MKHELLKFSMIHQKTFKLKTIIQSYVTSEMQNEAILAFNPKALKDIFVRKEMNSKSSWSFSLSINLLMYLLM